MFLKVRAFFLLSALCLSGHAADTARLGPDNERALQISGAAFQTTAGLITTVPSSATAASLNITVVNPEGEGYLTVWPCGVPRPLASNLNFTAGSIVPNGIVASLGADGSVCMFSSAPTDVIVDVSGWFDGNAFEGSTPTRLLDTREGLGAPLAPTTPTTPVTIPVASLPVSGALGRAKTIPAAVSAVALNVTVVNPSAAGFVTVWPCGQPRPNASNLNFEAGQVVANGVIAPVGDDGSVCAFSSVPADLIVDLSGWFPGGTFSGATPTRLLDSRSGNAQKLSLGGVVEVPILGNILSGGVSVPSTAEAVSLNVTVTGTEGSGYLTVWPCGSGRPEASNVNFIENQTVANNVLAPLDDSGKVCVFSSASTHLIVDIAGWINGLENVSGFTQTSPKRLADSRNGTWFDPGVRPQVLPGADFTCDSVDLRFSSQAEIDRFGADSDRSFKCRDILGSVIIDGADITNLFPLRRLRSIQGRLIVRNTSLQDFRQLHPPTHGLGIESIKGLVITGNRSLRHCTTFAPLFHGEGALSSQTVEIKDNGVGCGDINSVKDVLTASYGIQLGAPVEIDLNDSIDAGRTDPVAFDWYYPVRLGLAEGPSANNVVSISTSEPRGLNAQEETPIAFFDAHPTEAGVVQDRTLLLNPLLAGGVLVREQIIADFNGDGRDDIFLNIQGTEAFQPFPGYQNRLLLQNEQGEFNSNADCLPAVTDFSHGSSAGDVDLDGDLDIFVNNLGDDENNPSYLLINDGDGCFLESYSAIEESKWFDQSAASNQGGPFSLVLDMDGDGDQDIFVSDNGAPGFYENIGNRFTFTADESFGAVAYNDAFNYHRIDFNGDGLMDILIPGSAPGSATSSSPLPQGTLYFHLFENLGASGFRDVSREALHPDRWENYLRRNAIDIQVIDIDGDGDTDFEARTVVAGSPEESDRLIRLTFMNAGDGTFDPPLFDFGMYDIEQKFSFDTPGNGTYVDLNDDGIMDFVYNRRVRFGYRP